MTADVERIIDCLAAAFVDDPFVDWVVGGRGDKARRRYFALAVERLTLPHDTVWVADDGASAALWAPSEAWRLSAFAQLMLMPRIARVVGFGRMDAVGAGVELVERGRPAEPYLLLVLLGTAPSFQRRGLGTQVLGPGLAQCDAEGRLAVLDTSVAENLDFYRAHGFEVAREVTLPAGPLVWSLVRPPRQS